MQLSCRTIYRLINYTLKQARVRRFSGHAKENFNLSNSGNIPFRMGIVIEVPLQTQ